MTLQAILDCAEDSFSSYDENRNVWMTIRGHCEGLLGAEDFWRYQELCDKDAFDYDCEGNRLTDWKYLLDKFDPNNEDVGSSDYEVLVPELNCLQENIVGGGSSSSSSSNKNENGKSANSHNLKATFFGVVFTKCGTKVNERGIPFYHHHNV